MKKILVVGSLNVDLVQTVPRLPMAGETVLGGDIRVGPGGKGANQAVAAGRLGGEAAMIGELGQDQFGDLLMESLQAAHVNCERVGRSPGATGTACILVLPDGENAIVVSPGANGGLTVDMVRARMGELSAEWIVLCQLEIPLSTTAFTLEAAHRAGAITILDPAPAQALDRDILSHVTYLTPNETEAELLRDGAANVVLKLGKAGCEITGYRIPGFPVDAVDTTAAGDTFNGAFAVALAEGREVRDAARFANAAAALSVTRFGAQTSIPTRREVDAFLAAY